MKILDLAIDVAATTRLTRLVVDDGIARPVREKVESVTGTDSSWTYLVNCPYCVSVWAGLAVQLLPRPIRLALALSGGAIGSRYVAEAVQAL